MTTEESAVGFLSRLSQDFAFMMEDLANHETLVMDSVFDHDGMFAIIKHWRQGLNAEIDRILSARLTHTEIQVMYGPVSPIEEGKGILS